jgi:hypothetical protein
MERGTMAFMAAQTVALAARKAEASSNGQERDPGDEVPFSGEVIPEMVPLLTASGLSEAMKGLLVLFTEDPALKRVRFDAEKAIHWLDSVSQERSAGTKESNAWLDQEAARFAAEPDNRTVLEDLGDRLLEAAPR